MKKVLFINIALLFILIYVCISYNHRQAIVILFLYTFASLIIIDKLL